MKTLLVLIGLYSIVKTNGRLIEKNTEKIQTAQTETAKPNPQIRLTRQIFDDDSLTGFSREYNGQSDEFVQSCNRRARRFYKSKLASKKQATYAARFPRNSGEINKSDSKNSTVPDDSTVKEIVALVKKPIPKFSEIDYEDDFQMRISKSAPRTAESGDHEDEDFNLDDYDFDVNHDEFSGRGKPLEPRQKIKDIKENTEALMTEPEPEPKVPPPVIKIQSKVNIPPHDHASNKKERAVHEKSTKKANKGNDDYYDDVTTTPKVTEKIKELEDDFTEDLDESKEMDRKSLRTVRSPWNINSYVDKLGEKTSTFMSKILSVLPMFPQLPHYRQVDNVLPRSHQPEETN